jgi:hypothetical protein
MMMKEQEKSLKKQKKTHVDNFMHYYYQSELDQKRICQGFITMFSIEYRSNRIER